MTDELMAEIKLTDYAQTPSQQPAAPWTSGVAYASGAQSGTVYVYEVPSPHKHSLLDHVRAGEHPITKDADTNPGDCWTPSKKISVPMSMSLTEQ